VAYRFRLDVRELDVPSQVFSKLSTLSVRELATRNALFARVCVMLRQGWKLSVFIGSHIVTIKMERYLQHHRCTMSIAQKQ